VTIDLDYLEANPGTCQSLCATCSAGVLWERLFKYEDGAYQTSVCAPGLNVPWRRYNRSGIARLITATEERIAYIRENWKWL
jgi:hypothetical protein